MKKNVIAAQLYTLRDFLKTPADIVSTIKKVKAMGFEAVQASGFSYDPKEFKKLLDDEGLVCCATHEGGKDILETPEKIAEKLDILGCDYTAYPWPHTNPASAADYVALAKQLDKAGEVLAKAGKVLCYHNHSAEFEKFDKRLGLEIIYEETNPKFLQGEIDTYWVQHGGQNPVDWIKKLKKRLPLLHLKDYGIINREVKIFEIGGGNLDWAAIVKAGKAAGTKWFIIEEDTCRFDPFDSIKASLDYLVNEVP
jgi:sugar phosphate isomerase/epimerase